MKPKPSGAPEPSRDAIKPTLELLRAHGDWINFQFARGAADEIEANHLQEIIDATNTILPGLENENRSLAKQLTNIQNNCYAGKIARREYQLNTFLDHLRSLRQQLKNLPQDDKT